MHTRAKTRPHTRLLAVKDCAERESSPREVQSATATRRGARVMRAWLISASAVLLGSAGHTLAGGGAAHPMILALCTALGALAALGLLALLERITRSRQRAIYLGTAAGAITVQTLLHGVFNLSHGSAQAAHRVAALQGNHAHGHAHAPGTPLALEHGNGLSHAVAQHATGTMIGVHALAALLSLILLHRGERALAQALWALHCYLNTRLQSALRVPVLAPLPVFPRIYGRFVISVYLRRLMLAFSRVERGPPAVLGNPA